MSQIRHLKIRLICLCFALALTCAAPTSKTSDSEAEIISNEYTIDEKGNYKFSFKTSNGIFREESGIFFDEQPDQPASMLVIGRYSYINEEGKPEIVEYVADDKGYRITSPFKKGTEYGLPAAAVATLLGK